MCIRDVRIINPQGLHGRPASIFDIAAQKFECDIYIQKNDRRVNAKQLLGILSLQVNCGDIIRIIANGPDEQDAVDTLEKLIESHFEEKDTD